MLWIQHSFLQRPFCCCCCCCCWRSSFYSYLVSFVVVGVHSHTFAYAMNTFNCATVVNSLERHNKAIISCVVGSISTLRTKWMKAIAKVFAKLTQSINHMIAGNRHSSKRANGAAKKSEGMANKKVYSSLQNPDISIHLYLDRKTL